MLYHLLYPLREIWFGFNIFKYITFRASMAAITSFVLCLIVGPHIIKGLRRLELGQYVRKENVDGLYDLHKHKEGTPTMGGLMVLVSVLIAVLLWCRLDNDYVLLALGGMVWLGGIGLADDLMKIKNKSAKGIRGTTKIIGQVVLAVIVGLFVINNKNLGAELYVPFMKNAMCSLGIFYILFSLFVIVGASNALNLTDGLDGLAIGCVVFISITYAVISYMTGHIDISKYLHVFYLPGAGELAVFCSALAGASLGFLWYNCHPASIFMGDTGSLSLGGTIAIISIMLKKEILLVIAGGILVIESLSVIIQVVSYKTRGKRVFLMSPIHHHFQIKGLHESKITIRFWIIAALLALLSLATLKVR